MKLRRVILIFLPLLAVMVLLGLCFGSVSLSRVLAGGETARLILWQLRLPRVAAGVLAGIGLSTAGVLLQTVTSNDLAGPNIIGVNSGAGLAVIGLLTFAPGAGKLLPLAAFLADKLWADIPVLSGLVVPYLLLPVIGFSSGLSLGKRQGVCLIYPVACFACYLPMVFLLFNSSALFHCFMVSVPALLGNVIGWMYRRAVPKHR